MPPIGPSRHRLHDYEAGWLMLLVKMGIATRAEATEAQNRVARQTRPLTRQWDIWRAGVTPWRLSCKNLRLGRLADWVPNG